MEEKLEDRIRRSLVNGRLPCEIAFKIAEEAQVTPRMVKETADELQIKVSSCQLGCFP